MQEVKMIALVLWGTFMGTSIHQPPSWYWMRFLMDIKNVLKICLEGVSKVEFKMNLADLFCNLHLLSISLLVVSPYVVQQYSKRDTIYPL